MKPPTTEEPTPSAPPLGLPDIVRVIRDHSLLLVACLLLGIACGLFAQKTISKKYESSARFIVNEIPYAGLDAKMTPDAEQPLVQTLIMSVLSRDLKASIADKLKVSSKQISFANIDLPLKLTSAAPEANVRVDSTDKSRLGEIITTSQSPDFAADVANAILDNLQLFNIVGGRLNNLLLAESIAKSKLDDTVKQLVTVSSQRGKLEQENAELDAHIKKGLALRDFPVFSEDGTLNNLKTQLILVESEYAGIAASATRGSRLESKRAEFEKLKGQLDSHVAALAEALRSSYSIARTQQENLEAEVKTEKDKLDQMSEDAAHLSRALNDPAAMQEIASQAGNSSPAAIANVIITVDRATPRMKPVQPKMWLNMLFGVAFGLGLGGGLVTLRVLLDTRLRSARDVEHRTGQPCLALLPPLDPIKRTADGFDRPRSPIGLGYLRSHLIRAFLDSQERQIIGFTPTRRVASSSITVATLGIMLAQAGHRTLIIDLERKRPKVASALGAKNGDGLSRWLASTAPLEDFIEPSALENLGVLAFGKAAKELDNLLGRRPISMELPALSEHWNFILIVSSAIRFDWTMMLTLPQCCRLVLTADYRNARTQDIVSTGQRARTSSWNIEGVVLQNCPKRLASSRSL
ncbi:MAG TPA: hypothetical protein VNB29_02265 [Chthoniobacterales bacterium]|nr:hypothetical protein [Chthoniobacterales bacterium]